MRGQSIAHSALAFFTLAVLRVSAADPSGDIFKNAGLKKGSYIVELATAPSGKRDSESLFFAELDKRALKKYRTRSIFKSDIFKGVAIEFSNPEEFVSLADIANVVAVHPVHIINAPTPFDLHRDVTPGDKVAPYGQSTHYMTNAAEAHKSGHNGKGIKVAVIDSGVDYMHPNLGGGFGPEFKVEKGYDFVGDEYLGGDTAKPDSDPRDTCFGHGTHVAGIIGASGPNEFNMTGVAPEATIYAYRVFSCYGYSDSVIYYQALARAYEDGADVISMSFGYSGPWSSDEFSVITSRLAERGIVLTVSAGNDGNSGPLMVNRPAVGKEVIAVGSVQNTVILSQKMLTNVQSDPMPYTAYSFDTNSGTHPINENRTKLPVYIFGDGLDNAFLCDGKPPAGTPDLSQYAVLVRFPTDCGFRPILTSLSATNLTLLLMWDTHGENFGFVQGINFVQLGIEDGQLLAEKAAIGETVVVSFPQENSNIEVSNTDPGLMSYFSGWGPSADMLFKPALSAPGGAITSTMPLDLGAWAVDSGTSMSTPYLAGVAALLLEAKIPARQIRSLLQATALGIPISNKMNALPASLAYQGAGIVNVGAALKAVTSISPTELLLNDTANWKRDHVITIKNNGKTAETYDLFHEPAGTVISLPDTINYQVYPVPHIDKPATVHFSQNRFTVAPGVSAKVTVSISPPTGLDPKTLPLISGWVHVNARSIGGDRLRVSYMGFAGSLKGAQVISTGNDYRVPLDGGIPALTRRNKDDQHWEAIREPTNWTTGNFGAVFCIAFAQPSQRIVLDIIDARLDIKMSIPNPLDSAPAKRDLPSWWPVPSSGLRPGISLTSYDSVPIVGTVIEFTGAGRSGLGMQSASQYLEARLPVTFMNDTLVPPGNYRLLVRALHITGDATNLEDYDTWVSPPYGWNLEPAKPES